MKKQQEKSNAFVRMVFLVYCAAMLYLLFVRGRTVQSDLPYWEQVLGSYNLKPFHTICNYWDILARPEHYMEKWGTYAQYKAQVEAAIVNLAGNVLLFIPLGYFFPACFRGLRKFWLTMLTALGALIAVEAGQLLSLRGSCDIDDLILNLSGVLLGFALWKLNHIQGRKKKTV